ncbi:MAG TPA: rhomboid family intramembrane serine protease [Ramlibacter sp.]|uniref:rhomboid family intramembrane serine protease n=1 Tax=Ramlibacter sp. TaxID=1917967 RepID=UPI002B7A463B|nr:rhomboid family intramembrane serine protease [Ramlibacter sp.]HVZ43687.1 rhomboid family intramembrane serine protease [Ramlibacter sp.]
METSFKGPQSFPIEFSRTSDADAYVVGNRFGLSGKGRIEFAQHEVVITGRRRKFLRWGEEIVLRLPREGIQNVQRAGDKLRLELAEADAERLPSIRKGSKTPLLTFWASDEAAAEEIENLLPARWTEGFVPDLLEWQEFRQWLVSRTPRVYIVWVLIGLNLTVFSVLSLLLGFNFQAVAALALPFGNYGPATINGQWWRLLSYQFMHADVLHIAFNMVVLAQLGPVVERIFGHVRFLAIYLVCGIAGGLASIAWHSQVASIGASGSIFGVLGALLAYVLDRRNNVPAAVMTRERTSLLLFAGYNLFNGFTQQGTDNAGHLGGLACGLILGTCLADPLGPMPQTRKLLHRAITAAMVAVVAATLVIGLELEPRSAQGWIALADLHLEGGRVDQAGLDVDKAMELDRNLPDVVFMRGRVHRQAGRHLLARADFEQTVKALPDNPTAHNTLAWLLATSPYDGVRDGNLALQSARRACELTNWKNPRFIDTLAASYAESGQFEEAVRWQNKIVSEMGWKGKGAASRLELFRSGRPYREL